MRRFFCGGILALAFVAATPAQTGEPKKESAKSEEEKPDMIGWKWANFALLVAGLGYFAAKGLPTFFQTRTQTIQQGIEEAGKFRAQAETKAAAVEQKLQNIGHDIDNLRSQLKSEMAVEVERIRRETEQTAKRVREQAEQEIAFMSKAARQELKAFSASLALDLAQKRLEAGMTPDAQRGLVDTFVHELGQAKQSGAPV